MRTGLGRVVAIQQGSSSSCSNPVLQFANVSRREEFWGFLLDAFALEFQIRDGDGAAVFPAPGDPDAYQSVDVDDDCPTGHRLSQGRYVAAWDVASDADVGAREVVWRVTDQDGDDKVSYSQKFQVTASNVPLPDAYATIEDARAEGAPVGISDVVLQRALELASAYVEEVTGRVFYPRYIDAEVDGEGGPILQLGEPIIGVESLDFTFTTFTPADIPIQNGTIRIYNRHIRLGLTHPDDREDPRIEFLRTGVTRFPNNYRVRFADLLSDDIGFTQSQQNVRVLGLYGYTDPDGSSMGGTPELIKWATLRVAFLKYARNVWRQVGGGAGGPVGPVVQEKTMDQSVTFSDPSKNPARQGAFTGDPDTDQVLARYCRPPIFRSA